MEAGDLECAISLFEHLAAGSERTEGRDAARQTWANAEYSRISIEKRASLNRPPTKNTMPRPKHGAEYVDTRDKDWYPRCLEPSGAGRR
jgi:hypothetical protein